MSLDVSIYVLPLKPRPAAAPAPMVLLSTRGPPPAQKSLRAFLTSDKCGSDDVAFYPFVEIGKFALDPDRGVEAEERRKGREVKKKAQQVSVKDAAASVKYKASGFGER